MAVLMIGFLVRTSAVGMAVMVVVMVAPNAWISAVTVLLGTV